MELFGTLYGLYVLIGLVPGLVLLASEGRTKDKPPEEYEMKVFKVKGELEN